MDEKNLIAGFWVLDSGLGFSGLFCLSLGLKIIKSILNHFLKIKLILM